MTETVFHGSKALFDRFTLRDAGRLTGATNGALGVWVTPDYDIASKFGGGEASGYVYELAAPPGEIRELPLRWLMDQHNDASDLEGEHGIAAAVAHYDAIRRDLLDEGVGQIWIMEENGSAPTRVFLDPDAVEIVSVTPYGDAPAPDSDTPEP